MKSIHEYKGFEWIDLESPTNEEVVEIAQRINIPEETIKELLSPSLKHKAEFKDKHAFLVLHFPAFKESSNGDAAFEVDFIITKKAIVTTHYERVQILEKYKPEEENENAVFFGIFNELLGNFEHKLSEVDHWIREIEKKMFAGHERETIMELSEISRHLIDFKKITAIYPEVFNNLITEGQKIFGEKFATLARSAEERFMKAKTKLDILAETGHELRETNHSLLSTKQNESMKILTIFTIVASIIVGIALVWVGLLAVK